MVWLLIGAMVQWWNGEITIDKWQYGKTTRKKCIHNKMDLLTCPYKKFPTFDIIIWYLKHSRIYIYIMDVVCYFFEGLFVHYKPPI